MARTKEELNKLLEDFKGWYKADFDEEYSPARVVPVLKEEAQARMQKFIQKRLGHLPDFDLFKFLVVVLEDESGVKSAKTKQKN